MIDKIVNGVCEALHDAFDGAVIHTERVPQNLTVPCFSVRCISPLNRQLLGNRYYRNHLFRIQYFPSSSEPAAECNTVLDALFSAIENVTIIETLPDETVRSSTLRGTDMRGEVIDDVLNFFVNFNCFIYRLTEDDSEMEDLDITADAKG